MNGQEIFTLVKQILGGGTGEYPLSETLFYSLLGIAKSNIEGMRKWMVLRTTDTSLTAQAGNNWNTAITLPTNFKRLTVDGIIKLYDAGTGHKIKLYEVPLEKKLEYKEQFGFFSIDYSTNSLYIYGNVPQAYTIWLPYIIKNADITSSTTWLKFSDYSAILAFEVASIHRAGIDYDDQNARASTRNSYDKGEILKSMMTWDSALQLSSCQNEDYTNEE